ncbi:DUF3408 domain-containing protein [Bacteroides sp. 224]|uniref:DUF3408 domain-containing protein n=1 Tax=Bacteroides sp. 224 TaxID=2302936 RepID=UPI0013D558D4|nr:DUF3408 domain-containing protein [Bacteroides sp. 224]NDV64673.1 DUF3408 domain-containing protein [Bacteroides sp. 224]
MGKKENNEELDAAFIISQTNKRNREIQPYKTEQPDKEKFEEQEEEKTAATVNKEESRRRKNKGGDYESLFIKDAPSSTRSGKTVYIRKEFHDRIIRIIQVIGSNEISLYSYLDNVLEHHFSMFQEDISELYKKRNPDIF